MQQGPGAEELRLDVLQTTNLVIQQLFSHQKEPKDSGFWLAADHLRPDGMLERLRAGVDAASYGVATLLCNLKNI